MAAQKNIRQFAFVACYLVYLGFSDMMILYDQNISSPTLVAHSDIEHDHLIDDELCIM